MNLASQSTPACIASTCVDRNPIDTIPGMLLAGTLCLAVILFWLIAVALTPLELDHALQVTLAVLGIIPTAGAVFYSLPGYYRPRMACLYFTVALGPWSAMAFGDVGHLISYLSRDLLFWDDLLAEGRCSARVQLAFNLSLGQ